MAFHNGLTLAEIVWMGGDQTGPARLVSAAYDAFQDDPSPATRATLDACIGAWRAHGEYPFGGYLLP